MRARSSTSPGGSRRRRPTSGTDPVIAWVRGTALRPLLAELDDEDGAAFTREHAALLREAYPAGPAGTVFGFLRTFVVARTT